LILDAIKAESHLGYRLLGVFNTNPSGERNAIRKEAHPRGTDREREMSNKEEERRAELIAQAQDLGYRVLRDHAYGDILWRPGRPINPHTHSNANLDELAEMIEGIKSGREQGTAEG
jgi:hypothetical protein